MACFSYIEGWYNPVRLHSGLSYRSLMAYEADMQAVMTERRMARLPDGAFFEPRSMSYEDRLVSPLYLPKT